MRKAIIAVLTIGLLAVGAVSYAHMWGPGPGTGYGWGLQTEEGKKLMEETADLRKELHGKMFDYREAWRTGDEKKLEALEKDIDGLQEKISEKDKEAGFTGRGYGRNYGPGMMWGYGSRGGYGRGYGYGPGTCPGPYGW